MTWNLWWRFGPWAARLEAIREVVRQVAPDILTLQEVWDDGIDNQARLLAAELSYDVVWSPAPSLARWRGRVEPGVTVGNAVLSRWPIVASAYLALPSGGEHSEDRGATWARIDRFGTCIPVVTTQLNSAPHQSAARCEQVGALAGFAHAHRSPSFPLVVTGDFNAEPDSDEMRLLCGHKTRGAVPGFVLVDAWRYVDAANPGWTWNRANPYVRPTGEPSARIDYVLLGPPVGPVGHVLEVRLAGDAPVGAVWPSDHAAVVVDVSAKGR